MFGEEDPKVATSKDGVLNATAGDTFEYEVVVTKDGEEVAKSARQKVTVEDFKSAIIEITSVEVTVDDNVITSNKLAVQESAQLKVMGKTKLSKDKPVDITNNVKFAAAPPSNTTVWMIGMPYFKKPSQKPKG